MGKSINELTDDELKAEHDMWEDKVKNAVGWGASLGAAESFLKACKTEMRRRLSARPVKVPTDPLSKVAFTPTHRHCNNKKYYETVGVAKLCVSRIGFSDFPANGIVVGDGDSMVVYRDQQGNLFVRATDEFQDGRFAES